jgi:hypothetical protein
MAIIKKLFPVFLLGLAMAGCTTATVTNLSPQRELRNPNGLYPIEAALTSRQQTMRWETIRPSVVIGTQFYPMQPTALMKNRWETLIPVPPNVNSVFYRIKFDYDYNTFSKPKPDSVLSPEYRLLIMDK